MIDQVDNNINERDDASLVPRKDDICNNYYTALITMQPDLSLFQYYYIYVRYFYFSQRFVIVFTLSLKALCHADCLY